MLGAIFAVLTVGLLQAPLSLIGVMAAIARRVIRDMIATITVATTSTMGAVVIAAAAITVVTVRAVAMGVPRS
jgi:hypothetical protein